MTEAINSVCDWLTTNYGVLIGLLASPLVYKIVAFSLDILKARISNKLFKKASAEMTNNYKALLKDIDELKEEIKALRDENEQEKLRAEAEKKARQEFYKTLISGETPKQEEIVEETTENTENIGNLVEETTEEELAEVVVKEEETVEKTPNKQEDDYIVIENVYGE